tara:strand:- start:2126 stop:3856 length:1731 start_codon:yes stop_codon:yes gene_type:complete
MKIIQLTDIKFDPNPDYYLSEDALLYPFDEFRENKILVPRFLNKPEEIRGFQMEVRMSYDKVLPVLTDFFNTIHNENRSVLYWERIIGFWLNSIISNYLEKYKRLELAFAFESGIKAISIPFSSFKIPLDSKEYFQVLRESSHFHLQQYSDILKRWHEDHVEFKNFDISQNDEMHEPKKTIKTKFKYWFLKVMNRGYSSEVTFFVSLFSNKDLFKFFLRSGFKYAPVLYPNTISIKRNIDSNKRKRVIEFSTGDHFVDSIFHSSVKYFLPTEVFEGYSEISKEVDTFVDKKIPKVIFTGIGFVWSSQFAIWASKCADKGAKIYGIQHGGTYGDVEMLDGEFLERKLTDKYITWGWVEDEKTIPLPSSRLFINRMKHFAGGNQILWVTTADSRYNYFVGQIVFGNRFLKYFEHQKNLYSKLSSNIQEQISIRLYPKDFGWKLSDRWKDTFKNVNFSNPNQSFVEQAFESKLVIIDHLGGTTFLELITFNIPVIVVVDESLFISRGPIQILYDELKRVGVLYTCNTSASVSLVEILKNVDSWWSKPERKNAINQYKKQFALSDNKVIDKWFEFLKGFK